MVDYCENVLKAIRSAPTEKTLDGLVRDSITGFMRMRNGQLGSNYIMNMIAFLHSASLLAGLRAGDELISGTSGGRGGTLRPYLNILQTPWGS